MVIYFLGKSSGMGFLEILTPNCCGGGTAFVSHGKFVF